MPVTDEDCIDAQVDYTAADRRYWVRVDLELPSGQMYPATRDDGGPMGYLFLSPDEADRIALLLQARSRQVREQNR